MKLGGLLAFGSALMKPILAAANPAVTLPAYVAMNEAQRKPYDLLYADKVVAIIMTDGCSFGSLKNWLAQNQLIPGRPAYTSSSNQLMNMMNSGSFAIDAIKQRPKKGKKKGGDKTLGAIIESTDESSPDNTSSGECDPTVDAEYDPTADDDDPY